MYIYSECADSMTNLSRSKSLSSLDDADQLKLCVEATKVRHRGRAAQKRSSSGESTSPKRKLSISRASPEYEEVSAPSSPGQPLYLAPQHYKVPMVVPGHHFLPSAFSSIVPPMPPSRHRATMQRVLPPALFVSPNQTSLLTQQQSMLGLSGIGFGLRSPITSQFGGTAFSWVPQPLPMQTCTMPTSLSTTWPPACLQTVGALQMNSVQTTISTPTRSSFIQMPSPNQMQPHPMVFSPPPTQVSFSPILSPPNRLLEMRKHATSEATFRAMQPSTMSPSIQARRPTEAVNSSTGEALLTSPPPTFSQRHSQLCGPPRGSLLTNLKARKQIAKKNTSSTLDFIAEESPPVFDSEMSLAGQLVNVCNIFKNRQDADFKSALKLTQGLGCSSEGIRHKPVNPELWSFFLDLLTSRDGYAMIQWVNSDVAEFAILDNESVAHLWGRTKNKSKMNYDTMSRAIRYYYNQGIVAKGNNMMFKYNYSYTEVALAKLCENAGWQLVEAHAKTPTDVKILHLLRRFFDGIKEKGYQKSSLEKLRGEWHALARSATGTGSESVKTEPVQSDSKVETTTPFGNFEVDIKTEPGRLFDEPEEMLS